MQTATWYGESPSAGTWARSGDRHWHRAQSRVLRQGEDPADRRPRPRARDVPAGPQADESGRPGDRACRVAGRADSVRCGRLRHGAGHVHALQHRRTGCSAEGNAARPQAGREPYFLRAWASARSVGSPLAGSPFAAVVEAGRWMPLEPRCPGPSPGSGACAPPRCKPYVSVRGSWAYAQSMPQIWGIGIAPLLEWMIVPAVTLYLARALGWRRTGG